MHDLVIIHLVIKTFYNKQKLNNKFEKFLYYSKNGEKPVPYNKKYLFVKFDYHII